MMAKSANGNGNDTDHVIETLLARLIEKVLRETNMMYLIRAKDFVTLEGMCSYFEKHSPIDEKARRLAIRTLKEIIEDAKLLDEQEVDNLLLAVDMWNNHVKDEIASRDHWLGRCY
jgi:hypothetical protein